MVEISLFLKKICPNFDYIYSFWNDQNSFHTGPFALFRHAFDADLLSTSNACLNRALRPKFADFGQNKIKIRPFFPKFDLLG